MLVLVLNVCVISIMQVSDSSFFPQRVDGPLDVAGEDPSPATEEIDLSHFASEGKPTFKTQPDVLLFTFLLIMYLLSCI